MALSNWDTLGIGPDGKSTEGEFKFSSGLTVQIYKNWIYLQHNSWKEGQSSFIENTIGSIDQGSLNLFDVSIKCARDSEQSSVFIYATSGYGETLKVFAGIGCYGYL